MSLEEEFSYFFSSDASAGASNVSADGSQFSVFLNDTIGVPCEAKVASLSITQATILNNAPNISADIGNNVFSYYSGVTQYSHTIPDGQYSVSDLNAAIGRFLVEDGFSASAITISGDFSTNNKSNYSWNKHISSTVYVLLLCHMTCQYIKLKRFGIS